MKEAAEITTYGQWPFFKKFLEDEIISYRLSPLDLTLDLGAQALAREEVGRVIHNIIMKAEAIASKPKQVINTHE